LGIAATPVKPPRAAAAVPVATVSPEVHVHINETRRHHQTPGIHYFMAFRGDGPGGLQGGDVAVLDQYIASFFQTLV
jgi:hypothetical protein